MAAGADEVIYSACNMIKTKKKNIQKLDKVADMLIYTIPYL